VGDIAEHAGVVASLLGTASGLAGLTAVEGTCIMYFTGHASKRQPTGLTNCHLIQAYLKLDYDGSMRFLEYKS
jgi:hypothetical protein